MTAPIKGNRKKRIAHTSALVKALSSKELIEDENKTLSDKPNPDAKKPNIAPGIVRIAPMIQHTTSALSSFAQLSIQMAMMPAVVISVPIFKMYIRKKRRICNYCLSCDSWLCKAFFPCQEQATQSLRLKSI